MKNTWYSSYIKRAVLLFSYTFLITVILFLSSCSATTERPQGQNIIQYSQLLALFDWDGYQEAVITNPKGEEVARYVLIDREDSVAPNLSENAEIIRVPIQNSILDSEVYAGILEELQAEKIIKGMFDAEFATSPLLKEKIAKGEIINLGPPSLPDIEKITAMQPEVIFISYFEGMHAQALDKSCIPIIKMYDLQESDPLGRAEWMRFIGRLVGKGVESDRAYRKIVDEYTAVKDRVENSVDSSRKKILTEIMYEGVWNVAGGNSYQATLINDAGGRYFKGEDNSNVTLMLLPEQVLKDGHDADIWVIRYYGNEEELKQILLSDPIYAEINAYREGEIYFSDTSESGLFREFPFHPERILRDYNRIFTGKSADSLKYFKRLAM